MSVVGDVLSALKKVVLLQERLDQTERHIDGMAADLRTLRDYAYSIDRRVVRLETLVEVVQAARAAPQPPRIEG